MLRFSATLGFYIVLALTLTWPLAAYFTTHTIGDGIDDPSLAWNLWWINERLIGQANPDIFHVDWMFHPIQINLAFYTLTPLNGLISIPLQLGLSLIVANNLVLLASFVLGAFGAFLLVLDQRWWFIAPGGAASDQLRRDLWFAGAIFGGVVYAFASSKLFYASLGQFNIASSQWIPFFMLYLLRVARPVRLDAVTEKDGRLHFAAMAALFFTFQLWAELTYASFLLVFSALLFVWNLLAERRNLLSKWHKLLLPYIVMGLLIVAGMMPILWAMAPDLLSEGDFFASGGGFADIFSADLMGYLFPTILHPIWGEAAAALPFPNDKGQHLFLGYLAAILSALGLWALIRNRHTLVYAWLWSAALSIFFLLTLGPDVRWGGVDTGIPGPFSALSQLPFFSGNRYPSRYSVMLMVTVAVLSSIGLIWLLAKISAGIEKRTSHPRAASLAVSIVSAAAVTIFTFEHLSTPLPLNDFRIPPIYTRLAQEMGDFAVLELPTGWRNGARVLGRSDILIMMQQWWQSEHGKRRLGGNTSRNPANKFQYFTEAPLLGELIALMNADRPHIGAMIDAEYDKLVASFRPRAAQILRDLSIRFVVVHEDRATPQLLRFLRDALPLVEVDRWQGSDWSGAPSTIIRYAVTTLDSPAARTFSLSDEYAPLYLGEGWAVLPTADGVRYATRRSPVLLIDLPPTCTQLIFDWHGQTRPAGMTINGRAIQIEPLDATVHSAILPAQTAHQPVDRIVLHIDGDGASAGQVVQPSDGSSWVVGATGVTLPAKHWLVVRSAGEEVGDFAEIFVDGRNVAHNERGYNLAALDARGNLLASTAFDTSGADDASAALAAWIEQWPNGTIVAGAVNDEASLKLSKDAVEALRTLGVASDLRGHLRWSHAFIGAVGSSSGSAIETLSLIRPATAAIGAPVDAEIAYGGLRSLRTAPCITEAAGR